MNKTLVFDMDGTIADLYGFDGWLDHLRSESVEPYRQAKPLYNMEELNKVITDLKGKGWRIVITSWLAKNGTKEYNKQVTKAKKEWLKRYNFPCDEIHIVKYGTTKANATRHHKGIQVLIDDSAKVRQGWTLGKTIDANNNIIQALKSL